MLNRGKNMSRLLAFGCSNTFGHGLEDCLLENNQPAHKPSQWAFPLLLANKLNIPCLNLAEPGSSNQDILRKILSEDIRENDIVVILWTHYSRDVLYVEHHAPGSNKDEKTGLDYMPVGHWMIDPNNGYSSVKHIVASYYVAHTDIDQQIRSWLAIHHAENYLASLKTKSYLFFLDARNILYKKPPFLKFKNLQDLQLWETLFVKNPRALDGNHPGLEAHQETADLMYNIINNDFLLAPK